MKFESVSRAPCPDCGTLIYPGHHRRHRGSAGCRAAKDDRDARAEGLLPVDSRWVLHRLRVAGVEPVRRYMTPYREVELPAGVSHTRRFTESPRPRFWGPAWAVTFLSLVEVDARRRVSDHAAIDLVRRGAHDTEDGAAARVLAAILTQRGAA